LSAADRAAAGSVFLGVFLDHDPVDFGVAAHYTTGGNLRTGLSEASRRPLTLSGLHSARGFASYASTSGKATGSYRTMS
jgi:hypothetical protein